MGPIARDGRANARQTSMGQATLSHGVISSCSDGIEVAFVPCKRMP